MARLDDDINVHIKIAAFGFVYFLLVFTVVAFAYAVDVAHRVCKTTRRRRYRAQDDV